MKKRLFITIAIGMGLTALFFSTGSAASPEPYILGFSPEITGRRAEMGIANKQGRHDRFGKNQCRRWHQRQTIEGDFLRRAVPAGCLCEKHQKAH